MGAFGCDFGALWGSFLCVGFVNYVKVWQFGGRLGGVASFFGVACRSSWIAS